MRGLRVPLPHLPLLRHHRREAGGRRGPCPLVGRLPVLPVHPARLGPQPAARQKGATAPAHHAQVLLRRGDRRDCLLLGVREVRALLPREPRHPQDPGILQGPAMKNPYVPMPVTIDEVSIENDLRDIKTFRLTFDRDEDRAAFDYLPGQFAELSLFGTGESPIGIASSPTEEGLPAVLRQAHGRGHGRASRVAAGPEHGRSRSARASLPLGEDGGKKHPHRERRLRLHDAALVDHLHARSREPDRGSGRSRRSTARASPGSCSTRRASRTGRPALTSSSSPRSTGRSAGWAEESGSCPRS